VSIPLRAFAIVLACGTIFCGERTSAASDPAQTIVPVGSTRITAAYTYGGIPLIAPAVTPLSVAYVDGQFCSQVVQAVVYEAIWNGTAWPWNPPSPSQTPCNWTPATIRICEAPALGCAPEFVYRGEDRIIESPLDQAIPNRRLAVANFTHKGIPQTVSVTGWIFTVGDRVCGAGGTSSLYVPPAIISSVGRFWPPSPACDETQVTVRFNTLEFGELEGSFEWTGETIHYNVETGGFTSTPSPVPTPVQTGTSIVTVTYTYHGTPTIAVAQTLAFASVDGEACEGGGPAIVFETIVSQTTWPWRNYAPCNSVDLPVRICENPMTCSDEFTYTGDDVAVNLPVDEIFDQIPGATFATARFVHNGKPQTVRVVRWRYEVGGLVCSAGAGAPAELSVLTRLWPTRPGCGKEHVDVLFETLEFGELSASFEWNGSSVEFEVETPSGLQPTISTTPSPGPSPTITPSPAVSPAALPDAGGPPESDRSPSAGLLAGLGAAAVGVIAASVTLARRRTQRRADSQRR